MRRSEQEFLRRLADQADDTVSLFSDSRKSERERRVCAAFLRCLGISFDIKDLVSVPKQDEPPDVRFRDAAFEVKVNHGDQKVHGQWKARAQRYRDAKTTDDVLAPGVTPEPWSSSQALECVMGVLKKQKYSPDTRSSLDVLTYLDLPGPFLAVGSKTPETTELEKLGWRSVSVLFPPYACVLAVSSSAPDFLARLVGVIKRESNPNQWFEI